MTRDDLIRLLKEYKQNKARLNIKLKELKLARIKLKACDMSLLILYGVCLLVA